MVIITLPVDPIYINYTILALAVSPHITGILYGLWNIKWIDIVYIRDKLVLYTRVLILYMYIVYIRLLSLELKRLPTLLNKNTSWLWNYKIILKNFVILYNFTKKVFLSLIVSLIYTIITLFYFKVQFIKQLSIWFVILILFFWLISGFNFFLKRYQFGKFTSQIQRFWKRTNIIFWLIEGFLILIYFYYFLNSSQEPNYMYDYSSLNQDYLVSLNFIFINIIILSLVIFILYYLLLKLNYSTWFQLSFILLIISFYLFLSFFIETYQLYYIINLFNQKLWVLNSANLWELLNDSPTLRVKQQYLLICLIAKYWHFLFIFISWVFFLIKSFEKQKISYIFLSVNIQNIILLFALNFLCYLQWFKFIYRRFYDMPYIWFFTNYEKKSIVSLLREIYLLINQFFNINSIIPYKKLRYVYKSINLWNSDILFIWKFL